MNTPDTHRRPNPIIRIGRWSTHHPWRAIALWLGFVAVSVATLAVTGSKSLQNGDVGQSARAETMITQFRIRPAEFDYGYLYSSTLSVDAARFQTAIADVRNRMHSALGGHVTVRISADQHASLLMAPATKDFSALQQPLQAAAQAHPEISIGGDGPGGTGSSSSADLHRAELLALPVTLLVLLFAFGATVAAVVPVLLALTAVLAAFGLLGPISQLAPMDSSVSTIVLLIGMAVGVDYALFYVIRSRQERMRGLDTSAALERTAATSGRTVLVAGTTVAIAMAGQYAISDAIFNGIATGTITVVACAVVGSITVLPGLLALLGPRIDRGEIPYLPHLHTDSSKSRFWPAVVDQVLRRPALWLIVAAGSLVALAVPALGMRIAEPTSDALQPQQNAALLSHMRADFPSTSEPAVLVVTAPRDKHTQVEQALGQLERQSAAEGIAHPPFTTNTNAAGTAVAVQLPLTGMGDNTASRQALATLRNDLIPRTVGRTPGVQSAVTGATAQDVDFTHQIQQGMPYVIGFVLAVAFALLMVTFRSIVVPLKAIVLNLLSVAAAYGVLVLVFQHHWAEGLLGFKSNGAIISWLPLFLFVVLFGLSMDYHVFILSRVREGVDSGMTTHDAVRHGVTQTAGVVTSAALVMVGVFSIFGTLNQLDVKQAGVGLAAAILIDATIVRGVLLPASMTLLGDSNWYMPGRGRPAQRQSAAPPTPAKASIDT